METHRMSAVRERIRGSITALITPMKDGKVDEAAFRALVNWQVEQGTHGALAMRPNGIYRSLFERQVTEFAQISAAE